jgi:hypothetical protein
MFFILLAFGTVIQNDYDFSLYSLLYCVKYYYIRADRKLFYIDSNIVIYIWIYGIVLL